MIVLYNAHTPALAERPRYELRGKQNSAVHVKEKIAK